LVLLQERVLASAEASRTAARAAVVKRGISNVDIDISAVVIQ